MEKLQDTTESIDIQITLPEGGPNSKAGNFKQLLLDALDETLKHLLNETAVNAVYFYLENMCHMQREEITQKPETFAANLEKLMGAGALLIEDIIVKTLYTKLQLQLAKEEGYKFPDYVKELTDKYEHP